MLRIQSDRSNVLFEASGRIAIRESVRYEFLHGQHVEAVELT